MARPNLRRGSGLLLIIICLALGGLAACRVDDLPTDDSIRIEMVAPLFSPPAGDGQLAIRLSDENDLPIDAAALTIRADMTHAGMLPIDAAITTSESGVYRVPVRWTMAGDWIVTVEAALSDGRRSSQQFDLTVTGEEEICTEDQ